MKRRRANRRGQATVEVVILIAVVALGIVVAVMQLPKLISFHYAENRDVLASPL